MTEKTMVPFSNILPLFFLTGENVDKPIVFDLSV
jgi:hypothetical protein